jgi:putative inorganic carbon (hco3(-)) transporter
MRKSYLWLEQVFENRIVALVLAMIVIVPLIATPADSSLRGIAAFAFEFLGLLLLAALLWRGRLDLTREKVTTFLRTGANLPILLFLGIVALSTALSSHRDVSAQELLRIGVGVLLYFVAATQFRRIHHLAKLVDTLLYLAIVSSLIGFAHYATSVEPAATGQFGDHQLFGSFLMLLLPILVVTAVTESRRNRQLAAQIATVLTGTCLLLTQARGAWLGGLTGIVTMGLLSMLNIKQRTKWLSNKHEWILPIMLVVASLGFFLTIAGGTANRIKERGATITSGTATTEHSLTERQDRWTGTWKMIEEHLALGVGVGMYPYVQKPYTGWGNALTIGSHRNSLGEQAHNLYLQTAAELGIPGLLLLLAMIVTFFITGTLRVQQMHRDFRRNLLIGALGAIAGFTVDAIFSPSWQFGNITMFMWLIMGVGTSCMLPSGQEDAEPVKTTPFRTTRPVAVPVCLAMAIILPTSVLSAQPSYLPPPVYTPTGNSDTGAIVAGGIAGAAIIAGVLTSTHAHGSGGTAANARLLEPGDIIDIIVGGHKELSPTLKISQEGKIQYAAANLDTASSGILAAGMTTTELASSLQKSLQEYSKIDQSDQVIVRLNPEYVVHQSHVHKKSLDDQDAITQNSDGAHLNLTGQPAKADDDHIDSAVPTDTDTHSDSIAPADTDTDTHKSE